jgi:hypothetical protein
VALLAFAFAAPAANAALLSGVLPGLVSPSDTPATCDTTASRPFLPWGDDSYYVLAPGGAFETGTSGWTLTGGARVVYGNESYYVHSRSDYRSLYLPPGSSVTTPPMCFAFGDWKLRLFAASPGWSNGSLKVSIVVRSLLGVLSVLDGGTIPDDGSAWSPSPELQMRLTNITGLLATDSVSFRFTPSSWSNWLIDDVYIDPWKET